MIRLARLPFLTLALVTGSSPATGLAAQEPVEGEVRQLVSFHFLPGRTAEALELYRVEALPLYERNEAMRSFRGFQEAESPIPIDLLVISAFDGMAGMDASNEALRRLAADAGTSIGDLYGRIGALGSSHTDEFVRMVPALGSGDPSARRLTAFVRYRVLPGLSARFEAALRSAAALASRTAVPSATGRFLVTDGWDYLRILGFDSLEGYEAHLERMRDTGLLERLDALTEVRRDVILRRIDGLSVR